MWDEDAYFIERMARRERCSMRLRYNNRSIPIIIAWSPFEPNVPWREKKYTVSILGYTSRLVSFQSLLPSTEYDDSWSAAMPNGPDYRQLLDAWWNIRDQVMRCARDRE
jgi:hypothetical protein